MSSPAALRGPGGAQVLAPFRSCSKSLSLRRQARLPGSGRVAPPFVPHHDSWYLRLMTRQDGRGAARDGTPIRITEVRSARDLRHFLDLPARIYAKDGNWVAPLRGEIRKILDRRRNPFFAHGEACYWLAWRGEMPVGRISAQINRLHLDIHRDATGNFGFLEAHDDDEVFRALLGTAEAWLRARGMARILGPYSLSINDEIGVLISGFDTPPMVMMAHAPAYFSTRIAAAGYRGAKDLYAFTIDIDPTRNPALARVLHAAERWQARRQFTIRPIDMRRYAEELRLAIEIYNDAWRNNWGYVPVTPAEVDQLLAAIKPIILPQLALFAEAEGRTQGIVVALPNINEAIADLDGRLWPLGWVKLLWRLRMSPPRSARVLLLGMRKSSLDPLTRSALATALVANLTRGLLAAGMKRVELSWILEDNEASLAVIRHCGAETSKTYRLYQKNLRDSA
jgi:hypothetical protein